MYTHTHRYMYTACVYILLYLLFVVRRVNGEKM